MKQDLLKWLESAKGTFERKYIYLNEKKINLNDWRLQKAYLGEKNAFIWAKQVLTWIIKIL